jgi:O-glycosyl hydrolase
MGGEILTDEQIVADVLGTLTKFGFNATRANISQTVFVALDMNRDSSEKLQAIQEMASPWTMPPSMSEAIAKHKQANAEKTREGVSDGK